jgi:hypothetical protein
MRQEDDYEWRTDKHIEENGWAVFDNDTPITWKNLQIIFLMIRHGLFHGSPQQNNPIS